MHMCICIYQKILKYNLSRRYVPVCTFSELFGADPPISGITGEGHLSHSQLPLTVHTSLYRVEAYGLPFV